MNQEMTSAVEMEQMQPISRTYRYRKVMKPMLERKRRARINRCLDELKELMVEAHQGKGENVSKLEKADILELAVIHLRKLTRQQRLASNLIGADRFRAGFRHCVTQVSRCLAYTPGVDIKLGEQIMTYLGHRFNDMDKILSLSVNVTPSYTPPVSSTPSTSRASSSNVMPPSYTPPVSSTPSTSRASSSNVMPPTPASSTSSPHCSAKTGHLNVEVPVIVDPPEPMWRPW